MVSALLLGLALAAPTAPAPATFNPLQDERQAIVLCAQMDAQGKVVDARVVQSSGSPELDQSARSTLMGSVLMEADTAQKLTGVWLPVAIATNGGEAPTAMPSCAAVATLSR